MQIQALIYQVLAQGCDYLIDKKKPSQKKAIEYGGPWAIRTPDQLIKSQLLYRLS